MNLKIRKAKKEDFKILAKILMNESSKAPYDERYSIKTSLKEIENLSKNELYLAEIEKEIIGFIGCSITSDNKEKAYINELWLNPIYQKKGIGKALVKFIEKLYLKKGVKTIRLVSKKKSGAFKFYKKIKYKEYKEMVFMEKKLKWKR